MSTTDPHPAAPAAPAPASQIGVVAIGRNEGDRLRACLASVVGRPGVRRVVYVDSGSTDGSVALARQMGATVVELDLSTPFTAARARNAGFERLIADEPDVAFAQFIDGDCEVVAGWLDRARAELLANPKAAVVCGRRRERFPGRTVYNRLCDIEWDTPVGEARACGGDAMMRVEAFRAVGGYNGDVIAGEEPEMCVRLRQAGWRVFRLDAEMTLHDAAMTRFGQWWKRNVRAGHAYAEGAALHGRPPERHGVRAARSNWTWGLLVPLLALLCAWPTRGIGLALLLLAYPVLAYRVYGGAVRRRGLTRRDARVYALFIMLGKLPQALGQLKFHLNRLTGRRSRLIEYKGPAADAVAPAGGSARAIGGRAA